MRNPSTFAANVRVKVVENPYECAIFEEGAEAPVGNVAGFKVEVDTKSGQSFIEIKIAPALWWIEGEARYILDEATLQRLAKDNGFKLVKA